MKKKYYKKYKKTKKTNNFYLFLLMAIAIYSVMKNKLLTFLFILIIIFLKYIVKYIKKKLKFRKYLNSGMNIVDKLSGIEFEEFLLVHFKNMGYKGNTTPSTNDYGADLILYKDSEKIVVQAKRYSKKVGIEAVQQVIGAREYYKANRCIVITSNFFTPNAINLANSSNVELWDRNILINLMIHKNGKHELINNLKNENKPRYCKLCGSELLKKYGSYGNFYGCSNYPMCKYTENIIENIIGGKENENINNI